MLKKPSRPPRLDLQGAEALAANALSFLAEEPTRLVGFCRMSGIEPQALAASAGTRDTLRAVLEFLATDDSLLLVFTSSRGLSPETVHTAISLLDGGGYVQST